MSPFLTLMLAIVSEVIGTTSLKLSDGFSKPVPSFVVVVAYITAFYLMSLTLKNGMHLGTAYAIWSGLGTVGTVIIGIVAWRDPINLPRIAGVALIVIGVILLNLFAEGKAA